VRVLLPRDFPRENGVRRVRKRGGPRALETAHDPAGNREDFSLYRAVFLRWKSAQSNPEFQVQGKEKIRGIFFGPNAGEYPEECSRSLVFRRHLCPDFPGKAEKKGV
jgi:hypothetical protein